MVDFAAGYAHMLWTSMVQMIVILVLLLVNLGPSALAGYGLLVISAPIMTKVVQILARMRKQSTVHTDARVRLMQEILSSMRIIKFYAWEHAFLDKVTKIRIAEMKIVRFMLITRSAVNAVAITIPVFATILAFVIYSITGHNLQAGTIFSSLTLFNLLRMPLMFLPLVISSMTDAQVALTRVQKMLSAEEIQPDTADPAYTGHFTEADAITISMADFFWEAEQDPEAAAKEPKKAKRGKWPRSWRQKKQLNNTGAPGSSLSSTTQVSVTADKADSLSTEKPSSDLSNSKESDPDVHSLHQTTSHMSGVATHIPPEISHSIAAMEIEEEKHTTAAQDAPEPEALVFAPESAFSIRNLNLTVRKGELIAIVGAVGSGKSSFLSALVWEMRKGQGSMHLSGSIGFCAQVPWIMNATVRDNILFGREYDEVRYNRVVEAAALRADFDIFPDGDQTLIGERGITISGGQKQRLNIARATYYEADIILLDDPLSAVDAHVGNHLFEKCISGELEGKTRLLVTHQLHFLPRVDRILVIKQGTIVEQGTYEELVDQGQDFARILRDFGAKKEEEKDEAEVAAEGEVKDDAAIPKANDAVKGAPNAEDRETGAVSTDVYKGYFRMGGGLWTIPVLLATITFAQVAQVGNNLWLSFWSEDDFKGRSTGFYVGIYASFGVAQAIGYFALGAGITVIGNEASSGMHKAAIRRVLRAPMSFFDTTPQGRIINRFSKDVDTMDNLLSDSMRMFLTTFASITGAFILCIVIYHYFAAALGPLLIMFYLFALYYRSSAREIKRIDSIQRSSVFAQFGETLTGLATVRAYGEQSRFILLNQKYIDKMNGAYLLTLTNQRWLGIRLDFTGNLLILVVAILAVTSRFNVNPSTTGLVLSYTMQVTGMIGWMVRQFAEVENNMNATERVHHHGTKLDVEADFESANPPPASWPAHGEIIFKEVKMAYREGLPLVLKGLNLHIKAGERVGIVGRTGAGKSSILAALYRMSELSSGSIIVDDIDTVSIGLHELRSKLSIIPQDPVLFAGTVRSNLDPNNDYNDHDIWQSLRKTRFVTTEMTDTKNPITLDTTVDDEGLNFSLGQRQLIAMARAMLRKSKILVLDEATSSVDFETDSLIQSTIQNEFPGTTLLCIAHRLKTIVDYDRVCVMHEGSVAEFDTPKALYDHGGLFRSMCDRSRIVL